MKMISWQDKMEGNVLLPGMKGFTEACMVFNRKVNRRPEAILYPATVRDVQQALELAADAGLTVSVRNGGHAPYGQSLVEGGLVLDMRMMHRVEVFPAERRAVVQAGALLHHLDGATAPYRLAVPAGDCPMVGVTGLTLGGGNGFLSRKYGLTCDNLLGARLVTPDGTHLTASEEINPELFRALRGAGHGNYGVITELTFRLNPVPERMPAGSLYWPVEQAGTILKRYRDLMLTAPDELNIHCRLNCERKGRPMLRLYGAYIGDVRTGEAFFLEMQSWGTLAFHDVRLRSYAEVQVINEQSVAASPAFEWKSGIVQEILSDDAIDILLDCFARRPNPFSRLNLDALGGAISRAVPDATAFIHRDGHYIASIIGVWFDDHEAQACSAWTEQTYQALQPHFGPGIYQNYADPDTPGLERACYGARLEKLKALRNEMDPKKLLMGTISG